MSVDFVERFHLAQLYISAFDYCCGVACGTTRRSDLSEVVVSRTVRRIASGVSSDAIFLVTFRSLTIANLAFIYVILV